MVHPAFPDPPTFEEERVEWCRSHDDYRPMLFEWYKHAGQVTVLVACVSADSPGLRAVQPVHFSALVGLLNRCARLMLSNTCLSSTGRHGETTRLVDRCIVESAIKVMWLADGLQQERFTRFFVDGIRADLSPRDEIKSNIESRGGQVQQIEQRMLESIDRLTATTGMSEEQARCAKGMPNLQALMREVGLDSRAYIGIQRMGSHAVHGTWSDLVDCYLEPDANGLLVPRDHDVMTHHNQFVMVPCLVLMAARRFITSVAGDIDHAASILDVLDTASRAIMEIDRGDWGADFDSV